MNPEKVNPSNFKVRRILYNDGDFSVAYGQCDNGTMSIGMRWNGSDEDPGYPKLFNNPVWFFVCDELRGATLRGLIGVSGANNINILKTLEEL